LLCLFVAALAQNATMQSGEADQARQAAAAVAAHTPKAVLQSVCAALMKPLGQQEQMLAIITKAIIAAAGT